MGVYHGHTIVCPPEPSYMKQNTTAVIVVRVFVFLPCKGILVLGLNQVFGSNMVTEVLLYFQA